MGDMHGVMVVKQQTKNKHKLTSILHRSLFECGFFFRFYLILHTRCYCAIIICDIDVVSKMPIKRGNQNRKKKSHTVNTYTMCARTTVILTRHERLFFRINIQHTKRTSTITATCVCMYAKNNDADNNENKQHPKHSYAFVRSKIRSV